MASEGDAAAVSPDGKRLLYSGNALKLVQLTSDFGLQAPIAVVR